MQEEQSAQAGKANKEKSNDDFPPFSLFAFDSLVPARRRRVNDDALSKNGRLPSERASERTIHPPTITADKTP